MCLVGRSKDGRFSYVIERVKNHIHVKKKSLQVIYATSADAANAFKFVRYAYVVNNM